jgi:hypothetical protein
METGKTAWGAFSGEHINVKSPTGARMAALPMQKGASLKELQDEIIPNGALDRIIELFKI